MSASMEGYLDKWTNYLSTWKQRYFVLNGPILTYYLNKGERPKGRIHLAVCNLYEDNVNELKFNIHNGLTSIFLKAHDLTTKKKWIKSLKQNKQELFKINTKNLSLNLNYNSQPNGFKEDFISDMKRYNNQIKTTNNNLKEMLQNFENKNLTEIKNELTSILNKNESALEKIGSKLESCSLIPLDNNLVSSKSFKQPHTVSSARLFSKSKNFNFIKAENNYSSFPIQSVAPDEEPYDEEAELDNLLSSKVRSNVKNNHLVQEIAKEDDIFYAANDESMDFDMTGRNSVSEIFSPEANNHLDDELKIDLELKSIIPVGKYNNPTYNIKRNILSKKKVMVKFSIWSILKNAIGKDLSKFAVPVYLNEPLSMLQKMCENFENAYILNKAAKEKDPYIRLAYVATFCVSMHSLNPQRVTKFFNPLLGETFEYVDNEQNFRYFAEQVSHHPAITACYVEGDGYKFYSNTNVKTHFKLFKNSLEFHMQSCPHVKFDDGHVIAFTMPVSAGRSIVSGAWLDNHGKIKVTNYTTGDYAEVELKEADALWKNQGNLKGEVKDQNGNVYCSIEGNRFDKIELIDAETKERILMWKRPEDGPKAEEYFYFREFSSNLNFINDKLRNELPHTDSRYRPDQRALEEQDLDLAAVEKDRLEKKQRAVRVIREKNKTVWKPKYFTETYDDVTGEPVYKYIRDYWKDREEKNFSHLDEIY